MTDPAKDVERLAADHTESAAEMTRRVLRSWLSRRDEILSHTKPADHTERAREIIDEWIDAHDRGSWLDTELKELRALIAETLTAAERAGAEKMRALDEAVIEAARQFLSTFGPADEHLYGHYTKRKALKNALAARDAALTEGEER